jgi:hypothetical protein
MHMHMMHVLPCLLVHKRLREEALWDVLKDVAVMEAPLVVAAMSCAWMLVTCWLPTAPLAVMSWAVLPCTLLMMAGIAAASTSAI